MKGKGRVKTYILKTKKKASGGGRHARGRESTLLSLDTANKLKAAYEKENNIPGSSESFNPMTNTNSKIDLDMDGSDED